jgi:L-threonylcarbamoyladenylate synthase
VKTRIVAPSEGAMAAVELLEAGEVVALPTETVYGLGGCALDPTACAKIFEVKERPLSDPLIVHLPDAGWLERIARPNPLARRLVERFWPGPLTVVLPRRDIVPDLVTAGEETVAVRMSGHPVFRRVAEALGKPIAAPSANRFGRISPTTAGHVMAELDGRIPLILDGGPCAHGIESTIVLVREHGMEILRHGPVTAEQLAEFGEVLNPQGGVSAPGNMKSHYAPRTPLVIFQSLPGEGLNHDPGNWPARTGLLSWQGRGRGFAAVEHLSETMDLREAAANLYGAMRRLDEGGLELIVAEAVPETGLGVAIMDRLRKAAARE